ncbi:MAG: LysM peptidoglycan-binding domain-containing protein [Acidimicrobiia bacterium]
MKRTFTANPPKSVAWSRLVILLAGEAALLGLFLLLGSDPARRVDWSNLGRWLELTPPANAIVAVALLLGALGAFWLFATSLLYITARIFEVAALENGTRRFILPGVRRMIDGAFAIGIASSSLFASGQLAHAAVRTQEPVVVVVAGNPSAQNPSASGQVGVRVASNMRAVDTDIPIPAGDLVPGGEMPSTSMPTPTSSTAPVVSTTTPTPAPADDPDMVFVRPASPESPAPMPGSSDQAPTPVGDAPTPNASTPSPSTPATTGRTGESPSIDNNASDSTPTTAAPSPQPVGDQNGSGSVTMVRPGPSGEVATPDPAQPDVPAPVVGGSSLRRHTVVKGDNFWAIAAREVRNATGRNPSNEEVRRYWITLIEANRGNISSGNPNLIYAGEEFVLPPVA